MRLPFAQEASKPIKSNLSIPQILPTLLCISAPTIWFSKGPFEDPPAQKSLGKINKKHVFLSQIIFFFYIKEGLLKSFLLTIYQVRNGFNTMSTHARQTVELRQIVLAPVTGQQDG